MAIAIGQQLGSYEITALLGKGGMGEVYRGRDTKLKREVAIKILPDEFSRDADRVSRFQREAEVLAALNHPNIAAIYDIAEANDTRLLVLELVDGETLADRLQRGPVPVDEALNIAQQICEALEAAHEKGIVHRDLKPANVKITPDGKVKVLDFGLAKAMEANATPPTLSNSPTLTLTGATAGVIIGTPAYMSPEQARGRVADHRSDVFAFGCVLYEMLTGRQAFHGEDVSDVLASVMKVEPDFSLLLANLNPRLYDLLRRCLAKNRKDRWHAIGDVRVELQTIAAAPYVVPASARLNAEPRPSWKGAVPIVVTAIIFSMIAGTAGWLLKPSTPASVVRFPLLLPEDTSFTTGNQRHLIAISPDGTKLAYVANNGRIFLRQMSEMQVRDLTGPIAAIDPFFSPDGQQIGFYSILDRSLMKIAVSGGVPITVCKMEGGPPTGVTWYEDHIVFGSRNSVMRVSAGGGEPEALVTDKAGEGTVFTPQILDRGRVVLYTLVPRAGTEDLDQGQVIVVSLVSSERKVVFRRGGEVRYVPSGHLIYALGGNVLAVPFDLKKLEVKGGDVPIIEGVMRSPGGGTAQLSVSENGSLVYVPGPGGAFRTTVALLDKSGKVQVPPLPPAAYGTPRISPDGRYLAVDTSDGKEEIIWIYELSGQSPPRRLTFGGHNSAPLWSDDGRYIFFRSDRDGNIGLFRQFAEGTGSAERLTSAESGDSQFLQEIQNGGHYPLSLDASGKTLLFEVRHPGADADIWMLPLDGDRKPKPFLVQPRFQSHAVVSPDGHWVAYMSNESTTGSPQIFVQSYPVPGSKYQVTTDGGGEPVWSRDGKQLFYYFNSRLFAMEVRYDRAISFGKPSPVPINSVVQQIGSPRNYDVTPDGGLIVVLPGSATESNQRQAPQINVVLNWFEELKQRVPTVH